MAASVEALKQRLFCHVPFGHARAVQLIAFGWGSQAHTAGPTESNEDTHAGVGY
eukprot:SAG31_NODE_905_length_11119_cov_2.887931_15_plen_54_part_00